MKKRFLAEQRKKHQMTERRGLETDIIRPVPQKEYESMAQTNIALDSQSSIRVGGGP
jgi:hypothetical protein